MNKFIKQLTSEENADVKTVLNLLKTEQKIKPTIAFAGESGSGKSSSARFFVGRNIQYLSTANLGISKTTKVTTQISFLNHTVDEELLELEFVGSYDFKLINFELVSALVEKLTIARGKEINTEGIQSILDEILTPKSEAYQLKEYYDMCDEDTKLKMFQYVDAIIQEVSSDEQVFKEIKKQQQRDKNKLILQIYKDVFSVKVSEVIENQCKEQYCNQWKPALEKIFQNIKTDIDSLISAKKELSPTSINYQDKKLTYLIINNETKHALKALLNQLYINNCLDLVISRITFYANEVKKSSLDDISNFIKYSIVDVKGLEQGEATICECIQTLKNINANAVCVFCNIVKPEDTVLRNFIANVTQTDKTISINMIYTHLDIFIEKYQRNKYDEAYFSGEIETLELGENPQKSDDIAKNELYFTTLNDALSAIEEKVKITNSSIKVDNTVALTLFQAFSNEINNLTEKKLVNTKDDLVDYVHDVYLNHRLINKPLIITSSIADYSNISCELDDELIYDLARSFTENKDKVYFDAFYKYRNLNLHWKTKYTWINRHISGYGWASSTNGYDNIHLNILNIIRCNFQREIDKKGLQNNGLSRLFKSVKNMEVIKNATPEEVLVLIKETFKQNDFTRKLYHYMVYRKIPYTFNQGMYVASLDELNEKLQSVEYVEQAIREFTLITFQELKLNVLKHR